MDLVFSGKETKEEILWRKNAFCLKLSASYPSESSGAWTNMLIAGDNEQALYALLDIKKKGGIANPDKKSGVRLIYIDPPFSTGLRFRTKANIPAYDDVLKGVEFVRFIRKRLVILWELLAEDGSIFVHLDWKIAHYAKVVMDEVYGVENFLNDIIWGYGGRGAKATSSQFSRNHDIILWYQKKAHIFNRQFAEKRFLKGENGSRKDMAGRWFKTAPRGDYTDESIEALKRQGRIHITKNNKIRIKYFFREYGDYLIEETPIGDVWDDIPDAMHLSKAEKTGYPTQKPEALLERIIKTSTLPGDIVLDAFAGSGTTLVAAERLERRWIGIDSSGLAIRTARQRVLNISGANEAKSIGRIAPFSVYRVKKTQKGLLRKIKENI